MRMFIGKLRWALVLWMAFGVPSEQSNAQAIPHYARNLWTFEGLAAGYLTNHPEGGPAAFGGALGLERVVSSQQSLRLSVGVLRTVVLADDIALCHLLPDGHCLPDSVFPQSLWMLDASYVRQPVRQVPVLLFGGAGAVFPHGPPVGHGAIDNPGAQAAAALTWHAGLEVRLGSSVRAPRLQATRIGAAHDLMSLNGLVTVGLQLRGL